MSLVEERINQIEHLATDVLYESIPHDSVIPPVDLKAVADKYLIGIKVGPFHDPSILGAFSRNEKSIYVSQNEHLAQTSFTIAHELGHYFLHEEKPQDIFYRKDALNIASEDRAQEKEANYFATSLLMPLDWLKLVWHTEKDVDMLASRFGVTSSAAYWRLLTLGMIKA